MAKTVNHFQVSGWSDIWSPFDFLHLNHKGDMGFVGAWSQIWSNKTTRKKGTLYGRAAFKMALECSKDFANFPYDEHRCCALFFHSDALFSNVLVHYEKAPTFRFMTSGMTHPAEWKLIGQNLDFKPVLKGMGNHEFETFHFCLNFRRDDHRWAFKYAAPLVVLFFVAGFMPLFGGWLAQVVFKSMGLLLAGLFYNVAGFIHVPAHQNRPMFMMAYEFLLATTSLSLVVTLLLFSLTRFERRLPVPRSAEAFANILLRFFVCIVPRPLAKRALLASVDNPSHADGASGPASTERVAEAELIQEGWERLMAAINGVFLLLFTFTYAVVFVYVLTKL